MYPVVASGHSLWSNELVRDLTDEEFRHEYMMDQVRSFIAFQIRALREQPGRRWSQGDLAKKSGKTQSVISRSEDPDYGKLSLQSLLEIAIAFDLPLLVQFVEWDDWLSRMSNLSPSALRKRSFDSNRLSKPVAVGSQEIQGAVPTTALTSVVGNQIEHGWIGLTNSGFPDRSMMLDLNAAPIVGYAATGLLTTVVQTAIPDSDDVADRQSRSPSNVGAGKPAMRGIQEQPVYTQ